MKHGFVANGFMSHNTGRVASRDPSLHTVPAG